jgi:hypothetical protein
MVPSKMSSKQKVRIKITIMEIRKRSKILKNGSE